MRILHAIAAVALTVLLLAGSAAPHHHDARGSSHECAACSLGGATEARDATPVLAPPAHVPAQVAAAPADRPSTGAPLGAVPGQSPPLA